MPPVRRLREPPPHRGVGGKGVMRPGSDARAMLETPRNAYILFGVEPSKDFADGAAALGSLRKAGVVAFSAFVSDDLLDVADVLLPIGTFAETAGTFVNAEGRWQSFDAAADPVGEARAGWRVLRVLGNELDLPHCEYQTPSDIVEELASELGEARNLDPADTSYKGSFAANGRAVTMSSADLDVPIYAIDAVVRRAEALQQTVLGRSGAASVSDDRWPIFSSTGGSSWRGRRRRTHGKSSPAAPSRSSSCSCR